MKRPGNRHQKPNACSRVAILGLSWSLNTSSESVTISTELLNRSKSDRQPMARRFCSRAKHALGRRAALQLAETKKEKALRSQRHRSLRTTLSMYPSGQSVSGQTQDQSAFAGRSNSLRWVLLQLQHSHYHQKLQSASRNIDRRVFIQSYYDVAIIVTDYLPFPGSRLCARGIFYYTAPPCRWTAFKVGAAILQLVSSTSSSTFEASRFFDCGNMA